VLLRWALISHKGVPLSVPDTESVTSPDGHARIDKPVGVRFID
jgi:hypothetical protein